MSYSFTQKLAELEKNKVSPPTAVKFSALGGLDSIKRDYYTNKDLQKLRDNLDYLKKEIETLAGNSDYLETVEIATKLINQIYEKLSSIEVPKKLDVGFFENVIEPINYTMHQIQEMRFSK